MSNVDPGSQLNTFGAKLTDAILGAYREGAFARLPESSRRNVLGENAARLFGLNGAGRAVHGG